MATFHPTIEALSDIAKALGREPDDPAVGPLTTLATSSFPAGAWHWWT